MRADGRPRVAEYLVTREGLGPNVQTTADDGQTELVLIGPGLDFVPPGHHEVRYRDRLTPCDGAAGVESPAVRVTLSGVGVYLCTDRYVAILLHADGLFGLGIDAVTPRVLVEGNA